MIRRIPREEIFFQAQTLFHRPLVPRRRDSFEAQSALREDAFSGESAEETDSPESQA
jgi:hypothetical protein